MASSPNDRYHASIGPGAQCRSVKLASNAHMPIEGMRDSGSKVSRRLVNITLDNLDDLPPRCRACVFWELDPIGRARAAEAGEPGLEKESWVSSVLLEWGSCGKIAYVDGAPAARDAVCDAR